MAVYLQHGYDVPDNINDIVNPKDLDQIFDNALKHEFWKNNAIPVYDVDKSHMPSDVELDPSNPDSFFNFFWRDEDLEKIVKETNLYIQKKNQKKQNPKNKIKPTTLRELKRFMGVCMYMSTYKLPSPRKYWKEKHAAVTKHFTVNRFEQLRSSIHFNSEIGSANSSEESGLKVKPLIDFINERLKLLKISKEVCIDEMMIQSKSKFGPRLYQKGKPNPWGYKLYGLSDIFGIVFLIHLHCGKFPKVDGFPDLGSTVNRVLWLV